MHAILRSLLLCVGATAISTACMAQSGSGTPASGTSAGQSAPAAASAGEQVGRVPCESIPLGMTFGYPMRRNAEGQMRMDVSGHPTVGTLCPGSSAEQAGFVKGDVLLEINGKDFRERDARNDLRSPPGTTLVFRVRRGDAEHELSMRVPPRSSSAQ